MKWTLCQQYEKGRYLGGLKSTGQRRQLKPICISGISLASDPSENPYRLLAFKYSSLWGELWRPIISIHRDGLKAVGIERWRTVKGDMAAFQEWWLTPEKGESNG